MTQEEKARAYDEALERAKKVKKCEADDREPGTSICEYIFPELAESEDERIRNGLIALLKFGLEDGSAIAPGFNETKEEALAWLEKQSEKDKKEINNFKVIPGLYKCVHRMFDGTPDGKLLFEIGNVYKCLSKHDRAEFEVSYGHSVYLEDPVVCKHFIPFEKQGEQKPIDNIEPKFEVGDWVVDNCGYVWKIEGILNQFYILEGIEGGESRPTIKWVDKTFHLWTIQDAKDGDVIFYDDGWTCIFKHIHGIWYSSYCFITADGEFNMGYEEHAVDAKINGNANPATKEQRDLLFAKMKEAGYEWDANKKESKKIECRKQNSIEHTHIDAFIEKACKYIANHFLAPGMDNEINDFVNYMKG